MAILKHDLKQKGYSSEEAYFHKLNRELIEKLKRKNHLKLIQGGKSEAQANQAESAESIAEPRKSEKKAT